MEIFGWLVTILVFGAVGWRLARGRPKPPGVMVYVVLLVLAIVGLYVGVQTSIIQLGEWTIPLNWAIFAGCMGAVLELLLRNRGSRRRGGGT